MNRLTWYRNDEHTELKVGDRIEIFDKDEVSIMPLVENNKLFVPRTLGEVPVLWSDERDTRPFTIHDLIPQSKRPWVNNADFNHAVIEAFRTKFDIEVVRNTQWPKNMVFDVVFIRDQTNDNNEQVGGVIIAPTDTLVDVSYVASDVVADVGIDVVAGTAETLFDRAINSGGDALDTVGSAIETVASGAVDIGGDAINAVGDALGAIVDAVGDAID